MKAIQNIVNIALYWLKFMGADGFGFFGRAGYIYMLWVLLPQHNCMVSIIQIWIVLNIQTFPLLIFVVFIRSHICPFLKSPIKETLYWSSNTCHGHPFWQLILEYLSTEDTVVEVLQIQTTHIWVKKNLKVTFRLHRGLLLKKINKYKTRSVLFLFLCRFLCVCRWGPWQIMEVEEHMRIEPQKVL